MSDVVLIHGSMQNASSWDLVRAELVNVPVQHEVIAPELPADRPEWSASDFARFVADQIPDDATIVAHSASGILLPRIAQMRRVRSLVYLAAIIPEPGRSAVEQIDWREPSDADEFLFHDVVMSQRPFAHSTLRPMRIDGMLRERCDVESIAPVPSLCVVSSWDRMLDPGGQERAWLAHGAGMFRQMQAGHCPHIASPRHVASDIYLATNAERLAEFARHERDWTLRGRPVPMRYTGEPAPHTDYDTFLATPCPDRQKLFFAMTPENKAEMVRSQAQHWFDANRARLTPEQVALMNEAIDWIVPSRYDEAKRGGDDRDLLEKLMGRMFAHFTRQEIGEALVAHW